MAMEGKSGLGCEDIGAIAGEFESVLGGVPFGERITTGGLDALADARGGDLLWDRIRESEWTGREAMGMGVRRCADRGGEVECGVRDRVGT